MSACTFFGHRDCPADVKGKIRKTILDLMAQGVNTFYVGDKGAFDLLAISVLRELSMEQPELKYAVVLSYMPKQNDSLYNGDYPDTLYPEGLEKVPPRFAIDWRNKWMLKKSDYVVCYVKYTWGGAAKFVDLAEKQSKKVINLA